MKNKSTATNEKKFHDKWAKETSIDSLDLEKAMTAATSPELRFITKFLKDNNIKGKKILDIGCGFGEASVYFAKLGAFVTSTDISKEMLIKTNKLSNKYKVKLKTHQSTAESLNLSKTEKFDFIYAGNLMHHVDIKKTLDNIQKHMKKNGIFISWDPIAYNPIINIYRMIASKVRTPDEHPLRLKDIKMYKKVFSNVQTEYFWFTTLIIFILMLLQNKNPNKVRFWKDVVHNSKMWEWIYYPLEKIDKFLFFIVPPLKLLAWNAVIIAKK